MSSPAPGHDVVATKQFLRPKGRGSDSPGLAIDGAMGVDGRLEAYLSVNGYGSGQ